LILNFIADITSQSCTDIQNADVCNFMPINPRQLLKNYNRQGFVKSQT